MNTLLACTLERFLCFRFRRSYSTCTRSLTHPTTLPATTPQPQSRIRYPPSYSTKFRFMFARVKTLREWLDPRRFSQADRYVLRPYFESNEFFDQNWDM